MDKLKPIIAQKFWIFLGLALLLPFIGWFLATNSYATGVAEREQAIDGAFQKADLKDPIHNEKWPAGAKVIVAEEQKRLEEAQNELWNSQKQSMDWPKGVQALMDNVPYEGPIPVRALEFYSQGYFKQLAEIEQRLRPFDYETGAGVLLFDSYQLGGSYTHVKNGQWNVRPPTSTEMWNAQIDTWLVRAVFDSIVSINEGATKITEAPVRQLIELSLRGGTRDYSPATGGGDAGGGGGSDMESMYGDMAGDMADRSGDGEGQAKASIRFDLTEELGPAANEGGMRMGGSMEDMYGGGASPSEEGGSAAPGAGRYVDDDENSPFRTRAFVLGVIMDHRVLPEFLSELSRSDWPIQIIRVQVGAVRPDSLPLAGKTGSGLGPGGRPRSSSRGFSPGSFSQPGGDDFSSESTSSFSRSPLGGLGGSGMTGGEFGSEPGERNAAGMVQQALSDPYLAEVWIGGLITLFRPVDATETTANSGSDTPGNSLETVPAEVTEADPSASPDSAATEGETPTLEGDTPTVPGTDPESTAPAPAGTGTETEPPPTPPGTEPPPDTNN